MKLKDILPMLPAIFINQYKDEIYVVEKKLASGKHVGEPLKTLLDHKVYCLDSIPYPNSEYQTEYIYVETADGSDYIISTRLTKDLVWKLHSLMKEGYIQLNEPVLKRAYELIEVPWAECSRNQKLFITTIEQLLEASFEDMQVLAEDLLEECNQLLN